MDPLDRMVRPATDQRWISADAQAPYVLVSLRFPRGLLKLTIPDIISVRFNGWTAEMRSSLDEVAAMLQVVVPDRARGEALVFRYSFVCFSMPGIPRPIEQWTPVSRFQVPADPSSA